VKRVAILGLLHESNTFLSTKTEYANFASTSMTRGRALVDRWSGTHHELGGFLAGIEESGLEPAPAMATFAVPSGTISKAAYERLVSELLESLRAVMPVAGLLVALHGATVSEEFTDADGEILRRIRSITGPDLPIMVTLDLHANISLAMVSRSTAIVAYRSNPHLDQFERGHEAALLLAQTLEEKILPVQALEMPPLVIQISRQYTAEYPARELYDDLKEVLIWPGILSASVAMGFYYSDVEEMGASFLATADRDEALAKKAARWMADRAWKRRHEFVGDLPNPERAVRMAVKSAKKPVVLMDVGDNVGGGSPADSTILIAEILRQRARNALLVLHDPESVKLCVEAGVRATVELEVGAKTGCLHGIPVPVRGRVRTLSDGIFLETQVRHGGWGGGDQGTTAVVETDESHTIVLTSLRMAPMSLEQILSLGIHPERKDILIVKGVVAPRAAYEPIAGEIILVDTPGVTGDNPARFKYTRRRRPLFPLEPDTSWSAGNQPASA